MSRVIDLPRFYTLEVFNETGLTISTYNEFYLVYQMSSVLIKFIAASGAQKNYQKVYSFHSEMQSPEGILWPFEERIAAACREKHT